MKTIQITKQLYILKVGNAKIIQRCAYSINTQRVTIQNINESQKKYTISKLHRKKIVSHEIKYSKGYRSACSILQQHAKDLRNDPERLSTDFMKKIIGVKCK